MPKSNVALQLPFTTAKPNSGETCWICDRVVSAVEVHRSTFYSWDDVMQWLNLTTLQYVDPLCINGVPYVHNKAQAGLLRQVKPLLVASCQRLLALQMLTRK